MGLAVVVYRLLYNISMNKTHAPLPPQDTKLLNEYLTSLPIQPNNTLRLFAIGFIGLPGTGKSTVADSISNDLGIPLSRNDQIRRFLNTKGFLGASPRQDIMPALAEARTLYFYDNLTSSVIDANFLEYADISHTNAIAHGATLLLVRVVCPDEVAIERLRLRTQSNSKRDSAVTEHDFDEIKNRVATFNDAVDVYYEIDTTKELEPQLGGLYSKMRDDGYIN